MPIHSEPLRSARPRNRSSAFGYAMLTFFAVVVLHAHVSPRRWIGVLVVCFGVLLVGMTKPRTTETQTLDKAA